MTIKKLENLLKSDPNGRLEKVIQRAQNMDSLTTALRAGIAPELADNLVAAILHDNGELVLICSSPAWASRLRFESDTLLATARNAGAMANTCVVRVGR